MSGMRAHITSRLRSSSLHAVPPRPDSSAYSIELARAATSIIYRSPIPSREGRPVYILNAAALPDSREADFDQLLPYVLARLPEEDDLVRGDEYEVIFFAGDSDGSATTKKTRPGWGWFIQAYHVLSRAMRKRLQRLYLVHEKAWVRILAEVFSTIASPKFRRKITHASTLTDLALYIPIEDLLIPPSTYLYDRRISDDIFAPYASGRRAFGARQPFPISKKGKSRFPRLLRETTNFLIMPQNIVAEGVFRVPPHAKLKDVLKEAYDRGQKFIIWKDNGVTLELPIFPQSQNQEEVIVEIDPKDAYSVYMAAGLIKAWYSELGQPIFPPQTYRDLKRLYGDVDDLPGLERLAELLSPSSEWSILPAVSREIIVRHLLPLLSLTAHHQKENKMTAENLAVCFAPALLRGPDQLEDAKMSSIVRRIVTEAAELWTEGLRDACGVDEDDFRRDLRLPEDTDDWEDPVEGTRVHPMDRHGDDELIQVSGVIHQSKRGGPEQAPPLPPRSAQAQVPSNLSHVSNEAVTRRKPAPPLQVPPRYSTVVPGSPIDLAQSPSTHITPADGAPPTQWNPPEEMSGTKSVGDSLSPTQITLPKRKALTAEQIDNAEHAVSQIEARKASDNRVAMPGLADLDIGELSRRTSAPKISPEESTRTDTQEPRDTDASPVKLSYTPPPLTQQTGNDIRRPSWTSSYSSITSLARPVYPTNPNTNRPASKSSSLPIPGPKPRTPSPALLKRMPSFDTSKAQKTLEPPAPDRKLNLKKASVEDLRRLYEVRAGTAKTLVEAGKRKTNT